MTTDLHTALRSTIPDDVRPLDIGTLVRRGRRRLVARRALAVAALGVVAVAGIQMADAFGPFADDAAVLNPAAGGGASAAAVLDELIEVNRAAPAVPPRAGHALISQGVGVERVDDHLRLYEFKSALMAEDGHRMEVTLSADTPLGATAEDLRDLIAEQMGRGTAPVDAPARFADAGALIERAARLVERGELGRAVEYLGRALPVAYDPADRVRALQVLETMEPELVYRGEVPLLDGSKGAGITWFDDDASEWVTFIFDREAGRFLGSMTEIGFPDETHPAIVSFSTIVSSELVPDDGQRGG